MKKKKFRFKCLLTTLLSLVMIFASLSTAFASEPSLQRPEDPVSESRYVVPGYAGLKYSIDGSGVRLRRNPSLSGEVLGLLYGKDDDVDGGAWVVLTGEFSDANGVHWAQVSDSSIGLPGWVDSLRLGKVMH